MIFGHCQNHQNQTFKRPYQPNKTWFEKYFYAKINTMLLLYLYQIFIFLLGHLPFFLHFFFTFMESLFKKQPILLLFQTGTTNKQAETERWRAKDRTSQWKRESWRKRCPRIFALFCDCLSGSQGAMSYAILFHLEVPNFLFFFVPLFFLFLRPPTLIPDTLKIGKKNSTAPWAREWESERASKRVSAAEHASVASSAWEANKWAVRANERANERAGERVAQYLRPDF